MRFMLVIVIVIGQYIKKEKKKNQSGKQDELDNKADIISPKFIRNIDV